jgi:hypothetical protein
MVQGAAKPQRNQIEHEDENDNEYENDDADKDWHERVAAILDD